MVTFGTISVEDHDDSSSQGFVSDQSSVSSVTDAGEARGLSRNYDGMFLFDSKPQPEIHYTTSAEALQRVACAGSNISIYGRYIEHHPRISQDDYENLKFSQNVVDDGVLKAKLRNYLVEGSPEWDAYMKAHALVLHSSTDQEAAQYVVVPRTYTVRPPKVESLAVAAKRVGPDGKLYHLASVLADPKVQDKYAIPAQLVAQATEISVFDPALAAEILQNFITAMPGREGVVVTARDFTSTKLRARATIQCMAKRFTFSAAISSAIIGEKIFVFGPGGEFLPDGSNNWHVEGLLSAAAEVTCAYNLVLARGFVEPMSLLEMEFIKLGIEIYDGMSYVNPNFIGHTLPAASIMRTSSPAAAPISAAGAIDVNNYIPYFSSVRPVTVGGVTVATAVQVTGRHALINNHVLQEHSDLLVGDRAPAMVRELSRDLWLIRRDGPSRAWKLRDPVVGEAVVILYCTSGAHACTPVTTVQRYDSVEFTMRIVAVHPGTSGGAVIAISDGALLGVHSGELKSSLLASRFSTAQHHELFICDVVSEPASETVTHEKFRKKGLEDALYNVYNAIQPLFDPTVGFSVHIGTACQIGTHLIASKFIPTGPTCAVQVPTNLMPFDDYDDDHRILKNYSPHVVDLPLVRAPRYGERVYLVGIDDQGPYFSSVSTVVSMSPDSHFYLTASQADLKSVVEGAVVVSEVDGAVLGTCIVRNEKPGLGPVYYCANIPMLESVTFVEFLTRAFPFLHVSLWPKDLLEEVVTHSSVGKYSNTSKVFNAGNKPLANIGDDAAKAALWQSLRKAHIPHAEWQKIMQQFQSNTAYAKVAEDLGIQKFVVFGFGAIVNNTSKPYADVIEALIGAAFITEPWDVVVELCKAMKIIHPIRSSDSDSD